MTLHTSRLVAAAWVRSESDNEEFLSPLTYKDRGKGREGRWFVYEGELRLNPADDVTRYAFKVMPEGAGQVWLSEYGQTLYFPKRFFEGDLSNNAVSGKYFYEGDAVVAKAWDALELDLTRLGLTDEPLQSFFERETVRLADGCLSLTLELCRGQIFTL